LSDSNRSRTGTTSDRTAGALVILMALLVAFESRTFTVGFVTDPLGPKAFPLVSALLLLAGGVAIQFRPGMDSNWTTWRRLLRVGVAAVCLLAYALLLGFIGFVTATMMVVAVFAVLLGGRPLPAIVTGAIGAALLYGLFSYLLDIALPVGSLFVLGG